MSRYDRGDFWSTAPAEGFYVCSGCFGDPHIRSHIESNLETNECDFCGRRSRKRPIAAPLESVVELMANALTREYERAVEALGWESAEGGYLGPHYDSYDLLSDEIGLDLPNDDGRLLEVLADCFGDEPWCQRDPYSLRPDELLVFSWRNFCEITKYKRRYFFMHNAHKKNNEYLGAAQILNVVRDAANEYDLVRRFSPGLLLYRARHLRPGENLRSPYDFGPPPVERAMRSNRMSPAGIVMFYSSQDRLTAVAEIDDDSNLGIAVGTFRTTRECRLLDLTALPKEFGFFEEQPDTSTVDRYSVAFLHSFVASMAAKVEPGEREHIDCVPTQVVTEYFRTMFRTSDGKELDGIRYPSAQEKSGVSIVLFADRSQLVVTPSQIEEAAKATNKQAWVLRLEHEHGWLQLVRKYVLRNPA